MSTLGDAFDSNLDLELDEEFQAASGSRDRQNVFFLSFVKIIVYSKYVNFNNNIDLFALYVFPESDQSTGMHLRNDFLGGSSKARER